MPIALTTSTATDRNAQLGPVQTNAGPAPMLDVVIPVHNEQADPDGEIRRLPTCPSTTVPYGFQITNADNASTDAGLLARQVVRFAAIGVASTFAYVALFAVLRHVIGAQPANALALLATAIANTTANRRLTFGLTGRRHAARHQLQGLSIFGLGLGLTSGSLAALHAIAPAASRTAELAVVVLANLAATLLRFVLLRLWMYRHQSVT